MTPILYEKDEVDFVSQGLGSLAELFDVDVEEQRNGLFRLTASYPTIGVRYSDISVGKIILSKPNQRDAPHAFRIVSTELDMLGYNLLIEADSITYDLNHNIIKHLSVDSADGQTAMTAIQKAIVNPSIFTFYSDINHVSKTTLDYVNPMEAIMGVQGSFLQMWGGELKRENRRISMFNRRGRDNVSTFRLGKNIAGLKYRVDISSMVTRIIPTKSVQDNDQATTFLEGIPVDSQYIKNYEQIYTLKVDFTDENIKTVSDLNDTAKGWFTDSTNTGKDKPSVTIDIDVMSLQDSSDYQEKFQSLENVALTDTVSVYVPEYGVNVTAIVNEIHYDPIRNRVTKLSVGTAKQSFADSSRTQLSDLQNKVISIREQANQISISANGKNSNYYGNVSPSHPQDGDLWYWKNGEQSGIRQFIDGNWVDLVDSSTQKNIASGVEKAVSDAKSQTNKAISDNNVLLNKTINDVSKQQADLAIKAGDFNNKAQAMADKALSDAKANTATIAQQTASNAQSALDKAKTDLTTGINKEITDRNSAVTALDTKAKGYADSAKADAISVATTADGVINKKIDNTASSITSTISQNKIDAEGKISTAQSSATQALNELKTKVSQTDYNTKTGQLQTDLNTTSATATQSKQDIVAIKNTNSSQDSRMNSIESDASGTKQTVSDIQKANGVQDSKIATITSDVSGLNAKWLQTQSDINNLGQINQLVNTEFSPDLSGWYGSSAGSTVSSVNNAVDNLHVTALPGQGYSSSNAVLIDTTDQTSQFYARILTFVPVTGGSVVSMSWYVKTLTYTTYTNMWVTFWDKNGNNITNGSIGGNWSKGKVTNQWDYMTLPAVTNLSVPDNAVTMRISIETREGIKQLISQPMVVFSPTVGTYVPGNYNNNDKVAALSAGIDGLTGQFTQYQSTNDGKVSKAQADITANTKQIATKVSQSDYDTKTRDLTSKVNTAQSTADTANTTIGSYKTSNDKRVSATETSIAQSAKDITLRATTADLNSAKSDYNSQIAQVNIKADGINNTVSALDKKTTTKFTTQQQTIDGISTIVDSNTKDLNSVTKRVTTAEGTLTITTNRVTGVETKQTTMAGQITQEISDRGTGDTNTLQSAKTFTQSSISGYDTGLQSQLTQTNSAFLATISSNNLIVDSSLIDSALASGSDIINWNMLNSASGYKWYYSSGVSYQGVQSAGFNTTGNDTGEYYRIRSQPWANTSFSGGTLNVSVDVRATTIGSTSTDYLIVYLREFDSSGASTQVTSITGTINASNNSWVNYRKKITVNANSKSFYLEYQMRGNGNAYIARPYVGVLELIAGGYTSGANNNKQTILALFKDNWSIGITDNIGKITSGIVGDTNSLSVINKNIILDAINTTVTGDFWAKAGSFIKLSASNITAGTINGNQINVTNINANNIVSGVISGANLNINLNSGQVVFQKGRIYDTSNRLDINIDQGYISTANSDTRAILTKGKLLLTQPTIFDDNTAPYLSISNTVSGSSFSGASFIARDYATITNAANQGNIFTVPLGVETFSGMTTGKATTGWEPTKLAGADRGVVVSGGKETNGGAFMSKSPYIAVGFTKDSVMRGDRIYMWSSYTHLPSSYYRTTSSGSNVYISSDGALVRSSSSSKYKLDIEYEKQSETANKLLTLDPATWHDKFESEQLDDFHDIGVEPERSINMDRQRYYGIIAEDLVKAGLDNLVQRNTETGEVEGVEYSKIGVALIPIVRDLRNRLIEQNVEIERLKESNK